MTAHQSNPISKGGVSCAICGRTWKRTPRSKCLPEKADLPLPGWTACTALEEITQDLYAVTANLVTIQDRITQLEQAGVTQASVYWRKDSTGNPTILYLNHPSQDGQRKREYVGKDPTKQAEALARIERWEHCQHLLRQTNLLAKQLGQLHCDVRTIQVTAADLRRQTAELIPQQHSREKTL